MQTPDGGSGSSTDNGDSLDGDVCCTFHPPAGPQQQYPSGLPPAANYALLGARPFDLGTMIRGHSAVPAPASDYGGKLSAAAIAETPLTHPHGFGVAFAIGLGGTVSPSSGAFVHPFTLLCLPSHAPRMGVDLALKYLSNAQHPLLDPKPFGTGFLLSGHDFIEEDFASTGTQGAAKVTVYRGDGEPIPYLRLTGSCGGSPDVCTYSGPTAAFDSVRSIHDGTSLTYVRKLLDGREITYTRIGTSGPRFKRSQIRDQYGNTVSYQWTEVAAIGGQVALIHSITDTRGVVIWFEWETPQGAAARVKSVWIDTQSGQFDPSDTSQGIAPVLDEDLMVKFSYDAQRRLQRVEWFPNETVRDANGDGRVQLSESTFGVRPTVEIAYAANEKISQVWDSTLATAPVLRIHNEWTFDSTFGPRVTAQAEGGLLGSPGVITHTYGYPNEDNRTYTDPRGTLVSLETKRINGYQTTKVKMDPTFDPRSADFPGPASPVWLHDHDSLEWEIAYHACCPLVQRIKCPEDIDWEFAWATGNSLASIDVEVNGVLQRMHTFTYHTVHKDKVEAWWPGPQSGAARVSYAYTLGSNDQVTRIDLATRSFSDARGVFSNGLTARADFDALGRVSNTTNGRGGQTAYSYHGHAAPAAKGRYLLRRLEGAAAGADLALDFSCDDLGRLSAIRRGLTGGVRDTVLAVDTLHRATSIKAKAVSGGPDLVTEVYFDHLGSVTLVRRDNRDENGALRVRPWIQSESIYDALGRVVRTVADGTVLDAPQAQEQLLVSTYSWLPTHQIAGMTKPNGSPTTYVWDGYGLFYKVIDDDVAGGLRLASVRSFYDKRGFVVRKMNGNQQSLVMRRHGDGRLHEVDDPDGKHTLQVLYGGPNGFAHTGVRLLAPGATPTEIARTQWELDDIGRVIKSKRTGGVGDLRQSSSIQVLDSMGETLELGLEEFDGDIDFGRGWRQSFDSYGRLEKRQDKLSTLTQGGEALVNEVRYTYHATTGLPMIVTEKNIEQANGQFGPLTGGGHAVSFYENHLLYDLLDRVTQVTSKRKNNAVGDEVVHKYSYDGLGHTVRFEDTLHAELRWMFDALGIERRRTEQGTAQGQITTTMSVDHAADVTTRTDAEGYLSTFRYDKVGRLTKQELPGYTSGAPFSQTFHYDTAGRLTHLLTGNSHLVTRVYDNAGRLTEQRDDTPGGIHSINATKEKFFYDAFGRLSSAETWGGTAYDVRIVKVDVNRDAFDRLEGENYAFETGGANYVSKAVGSGYGAFANSDMLVRRAVTAEECYTVGLTPDLLGRAWLYQEGTQSLDLARYRFDGGRVRERRQGTLAPSSKLSTTYGWDDLRRLASIETKKWDGSSYSHHRSRFDHTYDKEGHMLSRKRERVGQPDSGDAFKLDEYYRLAGAKLGVDATQFAQFASGTLGFDQVSGYQSWTDYSPPGQELDKAQNRREVRQTANGTTVPTTYVHTASATPGGSHRYDSVGGVPLIYDAEGSLMFDGQKFFLYDFKNRLSEVWAFVPADGESGIMMSGARSGSRSEMRYIVAPARLHRLRERARDTLLHRSRLGRGYADVTGRSAYANQTSSAEQEGTLQLIASYAYDPFNRRIFRSVVDGATCYSTYDGWREVAEYHPVYQGGWTLQPRRAYVWGERLDELIRYSTTTNNGTSWTHYYPQQDHQDSIDLVLDANGDVKEKREYDPFGGMKVFIWSGSAWGLVAVPESELMYGYTGRRWDPETGLYYYRNRYYAPAIGRFLTEDPIGLWGDRNSVGNALVYVGNSPAFLVDPLGLQVIDPVEEENEIGPSGRSITTNDWRRGLTWAGRKVGDALGKKCLGAAGEGMRNGWAAGGGFWDQVSEAMAGAIAGAIRGLEAAMTDPVSQFVMDDAIALLEPDGKPSRELPSDWPGIPQGFDITNNRIGYRFGISSWEVRIGADFTGDITRLRGAELERAGFTAEIRFGGRR